MNETKQMGKEVVASNLMWRLAERCGAQVVSFVVGVVLARILSPEDYGLVAMATVIITILNVFVDSGMASALIQKKEADELDFSSVFYFNIIFCLIIYLGLFLASPIIASYYSMPQIKNIIRVLGILVLISGIKNTQMSYVSKRMLFRKFFWATLGGTILSAFVGIVMACLGYGVWALVFQQLINASVDTLILWCSVKWRPKCIFSFKRLSCLVQYGWKILASNLLEAIYSNVRQMIVGVLYSPADLAFYNKGQSFPVLITENINSSINSVLLPTMSWAQDDTDKIRIMTQKSIKICTYIMAPIMLGLFFVSESFVVLLLTEKWISCVPYLKIFCITYMLYPLQTINQNAILAQGRSDIYLKLEFVKKLISILLLVISINFGVIAIAYSFLIGTVISICINACLNERFLNYKIKQQIKDVFPSFVLASAMGICVGLLGCLKWKLEIVLFVQVFAGISFYIIGSIILGIDSYKYLLDLIKKCLGKTKRANG